MPRSADLSIAVVGLGFGANHARVLRGLASVRVVAVCDSDPERLAAASAAGEVQTYQDYETMLLREKLDAIVVASPARLHAEMTLKAIEAGCAVLVEKPLATSLEEGLRVAKAASHAGVPLMPGHIERFNPALIELRRRLGSGDAGRVVQFNARRTGAIRVPPQDVNVVHDSAIHEIDAMRFLLDGPEVELVYATAATGIVTPLANSLTGLLQFETSGGFAPTGSLDVNWLSPRWLRDLSVLCENGLYHLDYAAQTLDFYPPPPRSGPVQGWSLARGMSRDAATAIPIEPREQLLSELEAFVAAVRGEQPMPVGPDDGLAALAAADALTESARTRQPVQPAKWSLLD